MLETQNQSSPLSRRELIGRCLVSCVFVILTHLVLSVIPRFFSALSFLTQLALSALLLLLLLGFGGWCRRTLLRSKASAPAFVFFNILFIWVFYFSVVRPAVPQLNDAVFNCGVVFLFIGLYRIMTSDPGIVRNGSASLQQRMESPFSQVDEELEQFASGLAHESTQDSGFLMRVRYCKTCKVYIKGLDHHCPAFGNCIGQNNHPLFLILLFGFIGTEAAYLVCSSLSVAKSGILERPSQLTLSEDLVVSTILFTILQLLWQVLFVIWHIYCVCTNIRTDEWINWKKYPEFQLVIPPEPGQNFANIRFWNPYDKGIVQNVKNFLALRS
ncbi:PREDICTED: probable S-acyltransferase At2g14255-like [Fragaria vesca subsp. vesca]